MEINFIKLEHAQNALRGKIFYSEWRPTYEFSFYIHRNGKVIHKTPYGRSNFIEFDLMDQSGYYMISGFIRDSESGNSVYKNSTPILINPELFDKSTLPELGFLSKAMIFRIDGWDIPLLYWPSPKKRLFILTPSAIDRSKDSLPSFSRMTRAANQLFDGHVICIADPTLYLNEEMEIGWCLGLRSFDLSSAIANLAINAANSLGISLDNVIIWGSSAGGFAALAIAERVDGSTAVAINAQTDIFLYERESQVSLVRKYVFESLPEDVIRAEMDYRVNIMALRKSKEKNKSRVILVQNILDHHHFSSHFSPLWAEIGGAYLEDDGWYSAGNNLAYLYKDSRGHIAETEEMTCEIMERL